MKNSKILLSICLISFSCIVKGQVNFEPDSTFVYKTTVETDTTEKGYGMKKVGESRKTEISPCDNVVSGVPPTLVLHGTADKTVPFENVERFTKLMNEVGNTCELIPFEGKGHGFFNGSYFRKKRTDAIFNVTMEKSMAFLKQHNFIVE